MISGIANVHILATASFAQQRIFLDEQVRFSRNVAIYNEPTILQVDCGKISVQRLKRTLQSILQRHKILCTSLIFNEGHDAMMQCIIDQHLKAAFLTEQTFENQLELQDIINQIILDPTLFDLSDGRVFHCRILRRQSFLKEIQDNAFIRGNDVVLIMFHHAAFDRSSRHIFFNDLRMIYDNDDVSEAAERQCLEYIDYTVHEHQLDMASSQAFWRRQLEEYNLQRVLALPSDRRRSSTEQRSVRASTAQFTLDNDLSSAFFTYASAHQLTPFQLGLAAFYVFLFKLSHDQSDLCISCISANRYRSELENMIGMFVATLPYRMQLQPHWSFDELVKHVRDKSLSILEHTHYPLQHILSDFHENQTSVSFLETVFDFITASANTSQLSLDGTILKSVSLSSLSEVAKFDLMCTFIYDSSLDAGELSCHFACSQDLYDGRTVATMSQRFQHLLHQLFSSRFTTIVIDQYNVSISRLSLILPVESEEMHGRVFHRLAYVDNEGMFGVVERYLLG